MATTPQTPDGQTESRSTSGALWLYVLGFVVCGALIFLLPPPYSFLLLLGFVVGSVGWGVYYLNHPLSSPRLIPFSFPRPRLAVPAVRVRARREGVASAFALLGFALMIAAALDFRPANQQLLLDSGALKLIVGGVAVGVAVLLSRRLPALGKPLDVPLGRLRPFWWVFAGFGALLLLTVAEINGQLLHMPALSAGVPSGVQYTLLLGGVVLVAYGFGGAPSLRPRLRGRKVAWLPLIVLAGIVGLALFLRLWNQEGGVRYLLDELHFSDGIMAVEGRSTLPILEPMSGQSPYTWLFPYWQTTAVAFLGHNWTGFRFVSAIMGTLTVLAAYGLARELFDRKTALIAALVLATFPAHVHFSRTAIIQIADPLFGTLTLMFIVRALRTNRPLDWSLAGVSLGMTQYFYEGARLLFPPFVLGFIILLALRGQMRGKWRGFLILLVTAVVVGAPVYYTLTGLHHTLFGRYDESGLGTSYWQQLASDGITPQDLLLFAQHMVTPFQFMVTTPDQSVYYGGQQALILEYLVPFFLFGCFYLAWRYPSPAFVIPLWIVVTALGIGLLRDTLVSSRYEELLPALALALAAGLRYLLPFFWREPSAGAEGAVWREPLAKRSFAFRRAIPVVAVGAIAAAQAGYYFGAHLPYFNQQVRESKPYRDGIDAVGRATDLPGNTQIFLIGKPVHDQNVPRDWLGFLTRDAGDTEYYPLLSYAPDTISAKFIYNLYPGENYAFFVDPNDTNVLQLLYRYFPGVSPAQYSPWDIPANREYLLFFVPSDSIPPRHPLKP